jgi:hypothetical protein
MLHGQQKFQKFFSINKPKLANLVAASILANTIILTGGVLHRVGLHLNLNHAMRLLQPKSNNTSERASVITCTNDKHDHLLSAIQHLCYYLSSAIYSYRVSSETLANRKHLVAKEKPWVRFILTPSVSSKIQSSQL